MTLITRKWTRAEFQKLVEAGLLAPEERVELIQGEIVALSPIDPVHASAVDKANKLLGRVFDETHLVRVQNPVVVGNHSEPQPDLCLISLEHAHQCEQERRHPDQADLLIEVANTSLAYDRVEKASLYASGGYPLYWIVNLIQNHLEIYSDPSPDSSAPFGFSYSRFVRLGPEARVELAGRQLAVSEFLPQL